MFLHYVGSIQTKGKCHLETYTVLKAKKMYFHCNHILNIYISRKPTNQSQVTFLTFESLHSRLFFSSEGRCQCSIFLTPKPESPIPTRLPYSIPFRKLLLIDMIQYKQIS